MALPTIDLDTRRYADLVEEARSLIPRHAPGWTDVNASDPGITILELLAYLTEQQIYRANRIPEEHRRAFLGLVGFPPRPPRPARAILSFTPAPGGDGLVLPAGLAVACGGIPFRLERALTLTRAGIASVQSFDGTGFTDLGPGARGGAPFAPFGDDPAAASSPALHLGFDATIPAGGALALHVEAARHPATVAGGAPEHHAARTVWEIHDGTDWRTLDPELREVEDETRCLTRSGAVVLRPPVAVAAVQVGEDPVAHAAVRCRLVSGGLDATPVLAAIVPNAVGVEQRSPARATFAIAPGTPPPAVPPAPGSSARLALEVDAHGAISSFAAFGADPPDALVLEHVAATATAAGSLTVTLVPVGRGTGLPGQRPALPAAPVADGEVAVWTLEAGAVRRWHQVPALHAAGRHDDVFTLDADGGVLGFGDGLRGRVVPEGTMILARYDVTRAGAGNLAAGGAWSLAGADDLVATALLGGSPAATEPLLEAITSFGESTGGARGDRIEHAAGRAAARLWAHERLVELADDAGVDTLDQVDRPAVLERGAPPRAATLLDLERLAVEVPGTCVARARAFAGVDGRYPGLHAPGTVTVVVVAGLPRRRPDPTRELLSEISRFLERRKTLGMRLAVVPARYVDLHVSATVHALPGADPERVRLDAAARLTSYLDPVTGGAAGLGWPFGRDVYRTEILQLLDGVGGVDHVLGLELSGPAGASCGNVCVPPTGLPVLASHRIEVTA